MQQQIGQKIRALRRERDYTQEELAELLGVSIQAVSKWETGSGMPDISQIMPLASIFGVTTDELFGFEIKHEDEEVQEILNDIYIRARREVPNNDLITYLLREEREQLRQYPNNFMILNRILPDGINVYSQYERGEVDCTAEEKSSLHNEIERWAGTIISRDRNISRVLSARSWMVRFYCTTGEITRAEEHLHEMPLEKNFQSQREAHAWLQHYGKHDYEALLSARISDVWTYADGLVNAIVDLALAHSKLGRLDECIETHKLNIAWVEQLSCDEDTPSTILQSYGALAGLYAETGDSATAVSYIHKRMEFDLKANEKCGKVTHFKSPLSYGVIQDLTRLQPKPYFDKAHFVDYLNLDVFDKIRNTPDFQELYTWIDSLSFSE